MTKSVRKIPKIESTDDNESFCRQIRIALREHLPVISRLTTGIIECQDLMSPDEIDAFMNDLLKSRISRRVIAEQHLSLTETFHSLWHFPGDASSNTESIGEVFLRCNARQVVQECWDRVAKLARDESGPDINLPQVRIEGHDPTLPYILSHLQYVIGELLRNSIQALVESKFREAPPPIEVLICETPKHVIVRISDQGGGIPAEIMPLLWSFSKGVRKQRHLDNLSRVPMIAATMQELKPSGLDSDMKTSKSDRADASLSQLSARPPNLRLGMGLPMSRIYAEYDFGSTYYLSY